MTTPPDTRSPLTMTADEICHELQCSRSTMDRMVARGELPKPAIRHHKFVRWLRPEFEACVRNGLRSS